MPALEAARPFEAAAYWVDARVLGTAHLYGGGFDPEGLLGVLSSAGQAPLGRNAIAVYVGSVVLSTWLRRVPAAGTAEDTTLTATTALATGFVEAFGPHAGALAYALAHVVVWYAAAAAMDRSGVRLRL